ncbi:SNO glutamine amidotransferase [Rhizopus microsporus var. microsporus]|uniref:glutaminase n=2 Tax=Rhizopus microsporus TaxID=58291 RepID=A0A2G4T6X6_RHIZD|nr:SNO glutamine amidotransferase [Rhizopus microsporus ATCC 52813]ORE06761.1 SNO glutamine amidotransferase [Rhizopus microsporus var. microsporus]PHZ16758.1 SNO glutamine amidotransferase [Rhizopus microsporus ATCC 52813]
MSNDIIQVVIGVLALQGAFIEHMHMLKKIPQVKDVIAVRTEEQLKQVDALIIPGGESTSMALIAERCNMLEPLRAFVQQKPTWGTCAGMIMLAKEAHGAKKGGQQLLNALDVSVNRNQFGSQKESFKTLLHLPDILGQEPFDAVFIRAPVISEIKSPNVKVVGRLEQKVGQTEAETAVAVLQDHLFATAFHPELTNDNRLHEFFVNLAIKYKQ